MNFCAANIHPHLQFHTLVLLSEKQAEQMHQGALAEMGAPLNDLIYYWYDPSVL